MGVAREDRTKPAAVLAAVHSPRGTRCQALAEALQIRGDLQTEELAGEGAGVGTMEEIHVLVVVVAAAGCPAVTVMALAVIHTWAVVEVAQEGTTAHRVDHLSVV